jgi:hypothetical protein
VPKRTLQICLLLALAILGAVEAQADGCPTAKDEIATDRPDVTNSSLVVPAGSFQSENGVNLSGQGGAQMIDGTDTRWRLGVAPCLEFLVDLPTYFGTFRGQGSSGFSDVAPAVKWQVSPIPGKIDLSLVFGTSLPTGAVGIAGRGVQPYLQTPWSWELHDGWVLSGMFTEFFRPAELTTESTTETTLALEKKLADNASVFAEYVGEYSEGASPGQLLNLGGVYRLTPTQQLDVHLAFGFNHNSPSYIVGVGYSFRIDGLFASKPSAAVRP